MKITLVFPQFTSVATLETIARNVDSVTVERSNALPARTIEVECANDVVRWHEGERSLVFALQTVVGLEKNSVQHGRNSFVGLVISFQASDEVRAYRLITSNVVEADWLDMAMAEVARVLGRTPATT
jgi:hypothetical protein